MWTQTVLREDLHDGGTRRLGGFNDWHSGRHEERRRTRPHHLDIRKHELVETARVMGETEKLCTYKDRSMAMCKRFQQNSKGIVKGRGRPKQQRMMNAFNEMMQETRLVDLGYKGQSFTWSNNREGDQRIRERIDRAIANRDWVRKFPAITIIHKLIMESDHCPIIIELEPKGKRGQKPFRFEKTWTEQQECGRIVNRVWGAEQNERRRTCLHNRLENVETS